MKIDEFVSSTAVNTHSKETLRAYRQDIERFAAFLEEQGLRTNQVKPQTITEYVLYLRNHHGRTAGASLSEATIARRLAVVSRYYDWLGENSDRPVRNPVRRFKRPKVENAFTKPVDDASLVKLVGGITSLRDKAIVLLFLYSGLRLSELAQLNKDSITLRRRKMPDGSDQYFGTGEVLGKGNKQRIFLAGPSAVEALGQYLAAERAEDTCPALFLSDRGTKLSCRAIQQIVDKWCKRTGVPHIHVHQLRHSFANRNANAGMDSTALRKLMGHKDLSTTQRYFEIGQDRLSREYHSAMEYVRQTSDV